MMSCGRFFCLGFAALQASTLPSIVLAAASGKVTSNKITKVGYEFESTSGDILRTGIAFLPNLKKLKGSKVKGHAGKDWYMSVDTTSGGSENHVWLSAEWITLCELGDESALRQIAAEVKGDMDKFLDPRNTHVELEGFDGDWQVRYEKLEPIWPQVTAPMMLEGIYDLMVIGAKREPNPLQRDNEYLKESYALVTKDWFQSEFLRGLSGDQYEDPLAWVTKDVLAFFSILLSNAKLAGDLDTLPFKHSSPKILLPIMPRTDWTTIYEQIKHKIPGNRLVDIIRVLACYKDEWQDGNIEIDGKYCDGTVRDPEPNDEIEKQTWETTHIFHDNSKQELTNSEWFTSIQNGQMPDAMSQWDEDYFLGQIGQFRAKMEYVYRTFREVPIWEFRGIKQVEIFEILDLMVSTRAEIIRLHELYPQAPRVEGVRVP